MTEPKNPKPAPIEVSDPPAVPPRQPDPEPESDDPGINANVVS